MYNNMNNTNDSNTFDNHIVTSYIDFVNTILKLSQKFKKLYFIIRFKDKKTLTLQL